MVLRHDEDPRGARRPAGWATRLGLASCVSLAVAGAPRAADVGRLKEITDKWRKGRAAEHPLETYLRPLVKSDSAFARDPGPALGRLGGPMRRTWFGLQYLLSPELQAQFLG